MLHLLIKPFQDNDEEGSADSDDACTIMPPAAVCEPLRFDLASVCTAPKSKQVSTYTLHTGLVCIEFGHII